MHARQTSRHAFSGRAMPSTHPHRPFRDTRRDRRCPHLGTRSNPRRSKRHRPLARSGGRFPTLWREPSSDANGSAPPRIALAPGAAWRSSFLDFPSRALKKPPAGRRPTCCGLRGGAVKCLPMRGPDCARSSLCVKGAEERVGAAKVAGTRTKADKDGAILARPFLHRQG